MITDKMAMKCFEHKDKIVEHLKVAIKYTQKYEPERLQLMLDAQQAMEKKDYQTAVDKLREACYNCMARAIEIHFLKK
jgi:lysyl-tRNA synthetase class I